MSIWEKVKNEALNQFIEVIEWLDDSQDTLLYRFPVHGQETVSYTHMTLPTRDQE